MITIKPPFVKFSLVYEKKSHFILKIFVDNAILFNILLNNRFQTSKLYSFTVVAISMYFCQYL